MSDTEWKHALMEKREYARIGASIPVKIQPLDPARCERTRQEILVGASVWAPSNFGSLREMASSTSAGANSILAQAIMEVADQIVRLRQTMDDDAPPMAGQITQLSGGGGLLHCQFGFEKGDFLEMRFQDGDEDIPPIRAVGEIVHWNPDRKCFGFRFDTLHSHDQELLMRLIYRIQRQELRRQNTRAFDE